jgi:hypothetical protein
VKDPDVVTAAEVAGDLFESARVGHALRGKNEGPAHCWPFTT